MLTVWFGKNTRVEKKKVLIIAEYIGESHNSTAYYWSQIVKQLLETYDVILIAPDTKNARAFSDKYGITTRYVEFVHHNKNSLFSRLFGQIKQTSLFMRLVCQEIRRVDLIFSGTNPIVTMFVMAVFRRIRRFKWLVLVHDVFPNNLVPAEVLKPNGFSYRFLTLFSKKVYATPDRMICIGRDMKILLEKKTGRLGQVKFVPNWASTVNVTPQDKSESGILTELSWNSNVVFQFFGNMGRLQGIPNLLKAIELTKHSYSRFLFIGGGSEENFVEQVTKKVNSNYGYERVHYYGQLDLEKNNIGLNACDVALVTLSPKMYGLGVPSKAYFSMAADKPILYVGDKGSELELLLSENELGWYCEGDNPELLAKLLDRIAESYIRGSNSLKPRRILEEKFSEQIALYSISQVVEETISL